MRRSHAVSFVRVTLALSLVGCAVDDSSSPPAGESVADVEQPIVNGQLAEPWQYMRAARLSSCTGTWIAPRVLLTASHCMVQVTDPVYGYQTAVGPTFAQGRPVRNVELRPGIIPTPVGQPSHFLDDDGDFADIAVVSIGASIPFPTSNATLAWTFPDELINGIQVGSGLHDYDSDGDEDANPSAALHSRGSITFDDNDDGIAAGVYDGGFRLMFHTTNNGDSGGPFYDLQKRVLGILYGASNGKSLYTSVPHHLPWILSRIGWEWPWGAIDTTLRRRGTGESFRTPSSLVCRYACSKTEMCVAFTHSSASDTCWLIQSQTAPIAVSSSLGYTSGEK